MEVGKKCVNNSHANSPKDEPKRRWEDFGQAITVRLVYGGSQKTEAASSNHYSSCESKHPVECLSVDFMEEKYQTCSGSGHEPSKQSCKQSLLNWAKSFEYICGTHAIYASLIQNQVFKLPFVNSFCPQPLSDFLLSTQYLKACLY